MTSVSIKLLDRLEQLVQDWTEVHSSGTHILGSLSNIHQQRKHTWGFYRPTPTIPTTVLASDSNRVDTELHLAGHPAMVPQFLQLFPGVIERLLVKQTLALEKAFTNLKELLNKHNGVVTSMQALTKDAFAKSIPSLHGKVFMTPSDIPVFISADWIDTIVAGYQRELLSKEILIMKLDMRIDGNVEVIQKQWEITQWLDLKLETDIRERVKLAKQTIK
ncbi:hypothetical protein BASA50_000218 [Batrachochytrium salamandrivorans]|uniref:Uncharacterized protein n=1 Tax=Batrachochytrium salamandrivorans TaxID=1357716 RepID=A0ABQ8EUH7_9FUNG|nr:hypothetical protein BASA62_008147 [Batrachochytrium salamandrivorans]KAH6578030.1 hypothetical protein BASA60_003803 [Batrachochytrium salamandrivorans]KAH6583655.1 hypothetical protein BASA61_007881 [Batrachochytrium salamandrivorans]KAH6586854.1 hypothetical protein BASA50_000218 [Batrachochytrium salamandrivorans]KAH9253881.1 hypothetical protein BASA81_008194 [Batrachochytrium salamandrivorans]